MFEENRALQRATAKGGIMGSGNERHLRNIARIAAYICGWQAFSSGLAFLSAVAMADRMASGPATLLMTVMGAATLGFVALGVVIFRWQSAWAYVLVLAWLALQVLGSMVRAPISLAVVLSIVLSALTGFALRAALQLRTVRRRSIGVREVEDAFD